MRTIKLLTAIALVATLSACAADKNVVNQDVANYETWKLNQHVEKSSELRGTFCNGEAFKWYHEGKYAISGTCMNGMVFHLPLRED